MALIAALNGPLFLLFFKCIPNNKLFEYLHFITVCILLFVVPAIWIPAFIIIMSQFEMIAVIFGIDNLMVWYQMRKIEGSHVPFKPRRNDCHGFFLYIIYHDPYNILSTYVIP